MRCVIQRVSRASVTADGVPSGSIGRGLLLLVGVGEGDSEAEADRLAAKIAAMRIFCDDAERLNLSLTDTGLSALAVSNFTLYADCRRGNRPSFTAACAPDRANELYEYFCGRLRDCGVADVQKGVFGADMAIDMQADGPITIVLDTDRLKEKQRDAH